MKLGVNRDAVFHETGKEFVRMKTQHQILAEHFLRHGSITTLEAMKLGICRLSERIREIYWSLNIFQRYPFIHEVEPNKRNGHHTRYRLKKGYRIFMRKIADGRIKPRRIG